MHQNSFDITLTLL
uniref:Uncharacterized protein n=1 Tax=Rhizophora mucronata TaxID=61149 RepID=A0A2P2J717_RHIMU